MGCEVVSVYADQVGGAIGYPELILNDLQKRDFLSANLLKQVPKNHPYQVYGFTQSFAEAGIFSYVLNKRQFFVFSSGRFLLVADLERLEQKAIMHEDKIVGFDVKGKLCVTGTIGGRIIVWDLQFFEEKINIKMPSTSINFSSISLSSKYIFCTDSEQPKNNVFCYDLRTSKLKAHAYLGSFEPTLKGMSWNDNYHVTVAADGVWFSRYSESTQALEVRKGMFRSYPKTSMTCLSIVNQTYLISGSIDGYIFLWAHYQCQKVLKVGEAAISQMLLHKQHLIVSNFKNNVRIFSYTIKPKTDLEEDEKENGEITEDFVGIIIDSYERSPLQAIVVSKLDENIYYSQTRLGTLFNKTIPGNDYFNKIHSYKSVDRRIIQYNKQAIKYYDNNSIWFIQLNRPYFQLSQMSTVGSFQQWKIGQKYLSDASNYIDSDSTLFTFIPEFKTICYVQKGKVCATQIVKAEQNSDLKVNDIQKVTVLSYLHEGEQAVSVIGLTHVQVKGNIYLIVLFRKQFIIFQYSGNKWTQVQNQQYEGEMPREFAIDGEKAWIEERNHQYRERIKQLGDDQIERMSFLHCVSTIEEAAVLGEKKVMSLGGDSVIIN